MIPLKDNKRGRELVIDDGNNDNRFNDDNRLKFP